MYIDILGACENEDPPMKWKNNFAVNVDFECIRGFDSWMKVVTVIDDHILFAPPTIFI
jgi:hypothetical protein